MSMAKHSANGVRNRRYMPWSGSTTTRRASEPITSIGRFPNRYSRADPRHNRARTPRRIASAPRSFHEAGLTCSNDPAEFAFELDDPMGQVSQEPQRLLLACDDDPVGGVVLVRRTAHVLYAGLAANVGP